MGVGRGAAVAVAAGLVLVALVGAAAVLRTPDSGTGGRPVADRSSVEPRHGGADGGGSTPPAPRHGASLPASPSVSPSATSSATAASSPALPSPTLPSVQASVTSVPTPTKHHGKPPKADHTPGHGATHGPWKP